MSESCDPSAALLAALADLLPEVEPAPGARPLMRAAIMAKVAIPGTHLTRSREGEWRQLLPGIRVKTLRRDPVAGTQTTLWRLEPGARLPAHPHTHEEECLLLEGSLIQDGVEYLPGDYLLADAGGWHAPFDAPAGALFLLRGELVPDAARLENLQLPR